MEVKDVSLSENVDTRDITSVEGIFNSVYSCAFSFPLSVCSFKYEPTLGYPTEITINCPIPDACYSKTLISNLEIH